MSQAHGFSQKEQRTVSSTSSPWQAQQMVANPVAHRFFFFKKKKPNLIY